MWRTSIRWGMFLLAALAGMLARGEDGLILMTEDAPPHIMSINGKIVGIAADKVSEMLHRANQTYAMEMVPWARAYQSALEHANTCVFPTTRTTDREAHFKWIGPLDANTWVLYGLASRNFHLSTLEEARPLRIGTYNGDVRDTYLRQHNFNVDTTTDDIANPRKLLAGRIDLWASGPSKAQPMLHANGWTSQIVPVMTFNYVDLYLACNPTVSDTQISNLGQILKTMGSDGTSANIEQRYIHWPN